MLEIAKERGFCYALGSAHFSKDFFENADA